MQTVTAFINNPFGQLVILAVAVLIGWQVKRMWLRLDTAAPSGTRQPLPHELPSWADPSMAMYFRLPATPAQHTPNAYASNASARAYASPPLHDAYAWLQDASAAVQSIKLSTLADADNLLIAGPKGSGKTTVLRTLLAVRADAERIALDPHASPAKWPCRCIGGGLRWGDISASLQRMQRDMQQRFEQLAAGAVREGEFPRRTYLGDEFLSIAQELDGKNGATHAGKLLISRLTQGRKVGECILIAAQNDTVEALGIQGNADLKSCFDYIVFLGGLVSTRAKYHGCPPDIMATAQRAERVGVVWHPERNNWYVLIYDMEPVREGQVLSVPTVPVGGETAPVRGDVPVSAGIPTSLTGEAPVTTGDDLTDEIIISLHQSGWSRNKIVAHMRRGSKQDRLARIRRVVGEEPPAGEAAEPN